jgi:hypothetical protein
MLTMAGIDLLAKFAAGTDDREIGKRFKAFCEEFLSLSSTQSERVWKVRNALVHSFGLYTGDGHNVQVGPGMIEGIVQEVGSSRFYRLSVSSLYWAFVDAVTAFERVVRSESERQARFISVYPNYGTVFLSPA